jgi:hypothetical protein
MNSINITIIALLFTPILSFTQDEEPLSKKEQRKNRTTYRGISSGGLGVGSFRDFATSPLTYNGISFLAGGFKINVDSHRETEWGTPFSVGFFGVDFNGHSSSSTIFSLSPYYSELYRLNSWSSKKFNVKVGGMLQATLNVRTNPDLLNNSVGLEVIPTLLGSIKGTWDISRKVDKNKKFLFIKYSLLKRKKSLAFRLNTGLVNASYRNGYAYSGQSFILNKPEIFDDYRFNVFSGFRASSSLDYTLCSRKTTNAVQISYVWDALKTGGDFDTFEMAQHGLRLTLLFNTK